MHHITTTIALLATTLGLANACVSIPSITYTGKQKQPTHSFDGAVFIDGEKICRIRTYNQEQFAEDKQVCVQMDCNPGYRMRLCRNVGDDWYVVLETEYGEAGDFKSEEMWVDVEDRGHHDRTLRLEWGGCGKKNWQETWTTTTVLSSGGE